METRWASIVGHFAFGDRAALLVGRSVHRTPHPGPDAVDPGVDVPADDRELFVAKMLTLLT
jgi:hypothetical protein